ALWGPCRPASVPVLRLLATASACPDGRGSGSPGLPPCGALRNVIRRRPDLHRRKEERRDRDPRWVFPREMRTTGSANQNMLVFPDRGAGRELGGVHRALRPGGRR